MKSILFTIVVLLSVAYKKCNEPAKASIPACVQSKIDSITANKPGNPAAEVHEYYFRGKRTFLFNAPCCDQYHVLYDESCGYVCAPSGGLTGQGDRKCNEFDTEAKYVRLVWKDEREPVRN